MDDPHGESPAILKANHERDEHKWNAERLKLESKINELERTLEQKDNERA